MIMKRANAFVSVFLPVALVAAALAQSKGSSERTISAASPLKVHNALTRESGGASGRTINAALPAAGPEILIRNATIMTASHGTINNGSILIRDGKIAAVGTNVTPRDPNARIIDASGKYVTPGIIDCHSHTAVEGNVNEGTLSVTAMVRIQDVVNP